MQKACTSSVYYSQSSRSVSVRDIKNKVIPEICNRESQPYGKTKVVEVPDKDTRGRQCVKAFTLIELLVVVLIIGILSAVALPQYEKAVDKSTLVCVIPILKSLTEAQAIAALQLGEYPSDYFTFDALDIDINVQEESCKNSDNCPILCAGKGFTIVLRHTETWANFYFWAGSLERLRFKKDGTFVLECASQRCKNVAKSFGGTTTAGNENTYQW